MQNQNFMNKFIYHLSIISSNYIFYSLLLKFIIIFQNCRHILNKYAFIRNPQIQIMSQIQNFFFLNTINHSNKPCEIFFTEFGSSTSQRELHP